MRIFVFAVFGLAMAAPLTGQVIEPKEMKGLKPLKPEEGVVRLSVRSQRQFIETAFIYFVEVLPGGSDGERILQFERGAGVPVMGTNMIDVKAKYYRVPSGRYRLMAYTVACRGVPPPDTACTVYGNSLPTGRYAGASPSFEVKPSAFTDAGDFVIEYIKPVDLASANLFDDRYSNAAYAVRWKPIKIAPAPGFATLMAAAAPSIPIEFASRIECEARPRDKLIQFPFKC